MTPLVWLILASLGLGAGALALFLWALRSNQYEDMDGAAVRILFDEVEGSDAREKKEDVLF